MAGFLATYTYADGSADLRAEHLDAHLAFIDGLQERGILQLVGRVDDAPFNIGFVLKADSLDEARAALAEDPYAALGAISSTQVFAWNAKRGVLGPL